MTLEERKRIVNLALEANEKGKSMGIEVGCDCYGGEIGVSVVVREKAESPLKLGKALITTNLYERMGADSAEYQECEAYLKKLLAQDSRKE